MSTSMLFYGNTPPPQKQTEQNKIKQNKKQQK